MCSLNADDDDGCGEFGKDEKFSSIFNNLTTCRSCDQKALVVLRKKDAYCKECFLSVETHKFRAALGKTKMMKPQDTVLFAYSGSQSSNALLHLLHSGVSEKHHKKLLFHVKILFIDEGAVLKMNDEERVNLTKQIKQNVEHYGFPLFFTSLSECVNDMALPSQFLKIDHDRDAELKKLFDGVKTITSKTSLLHILKQKLIYKMCAELKCNKIFTAEVGNDLAIKLLYNFSLGRGDQASFESGFCDSRNSKFIILRPLRDFLKKEIVFYNRFHNLNSITTQNFYNMTNKQSNNSIQKLTENFITDLQVNFPSTVYTVFRTGEKLGDSAIQSSNKSINCCICGHNYNVNNNSDYNALLALQFSKKMSKNEPGDICNSNSCCGSISSNLGINCSKNFLDLKKNTCYGCTEIINDMVDLNCIPKKLMNSAVEEINLNEMKNQISEFLIDDS